MRGFFIGKIIYNRSMTTKTIDIDKIARLSQMTPSPALKEKLQKQLKQTVVYIEELNAVDTTNIVPTNQVTKLENVLREDVVTPSLSQEEALMNSKHTHNGLFIVDAVLPGE